jgi:hypothetical protein
MSSMGLASLPSEVLEQIAENLPLDAFQNIRLASRDFREATSRLFAKIYLHELHLNMTAIDDKKIKAMIDHSTRNVWQASKLDKVFIHVWPWCASGPENSAFAQQINTRRALYLLPDSVQTVIVVPDRLVRTAKSSGFRQPCEILEILSGALMESRAKLPNLVIYSDLQPRMDYNDIGARMISLLGSPGLRWTLNHIQPLEPECISIIDTTSKSMPATCLTIHAHLDQNEVGHPYQGLDLKWLQSLTITSGRMDVEMILSILQTHRNTLRKILLHNLILQMRGWKRGLSFHYSEYPCLTLFEVGNAWERDFIRAMDRHIPANKILFGEGRGEANSVGRVEGEPEEMKEKIRKLKASMYILTALQIYREVSSNS